MTSRCTGKGDVIQPLGLSNRVAGLVAGLPGCSWAGSLPLTHICFVSGGGCVGPGRPLQRVPLWGGGLHRAG